MKNQKNITIPAPALELSHLPSGSPLSLCIGENTLVMLPERMTAVQVANTINVLTGITSDLASAVKSACGSCEDRDEGCPFAAISDPDKCPYEDMDGPEVELSDAARKQMGIPLDAKLQLCPDEGEGLVCAADYEHDITDVPENVRALFAMVGVCPGKLDELIMDEKEIYHG